MLILARKPREQIRITMPDGTVILLTVCRIDQGKVRLGFEAPLDVVISRTELLPTDEKGVAS